MALPPASEWGDRFARAGLAERGADPDDRRRILVRLSKRGQQLHDRLSQGPQQFRFWLQRMSAEDLEALHRGYVALARIAVGGNDDAAPADERPRRSLHVRSHSNMR